MRGYATSFCVLSLLGACTLAMDESSSQSSQSSSASNSNSVPAAGSMASSSLVSGLSQAPRAGLVYNVPIGSSSSGAAFLRMPAKRAFTYRTEFKRLPLYQFGLGKRSRAYAFGLGKRGKQYAFGLGKRSNGNVISEYEQQQQQLQQQRLRPDQMQAALNYLSSNEDAYDRSDSSLGQSDYWLDKRSAGAYNFGLGKRSSGSYYDPEEQRLLLPVKQLRNNKYVFGLGKRRLYDVVDNSGSSSSDSDDVEDLELELSDDEANSQ